MTQPTKKRFKTTGGNRRDQEGVTVLETLISMVLVVFALWTAGGLAVNAAAGVRTARLRFHLEEKLSYHKHRLISLPYDDSQTEGGNYARIEDAYLISWEIISVTADLKTVRLRAQHTISKGITRGTYFYLSRYIRSRGRS